MVNPVTTMPNAKRKKGKNESWNATLGNLTPRKTVKRTEHKSLITDLYFR